MRSIVKTAKEILKEHNLYRAPIDVVKLAHELGFTILQQNMEYSGAILVRENDKFSIDGKKYNKVILIDNAQSYNRKLFTIAHELAHYFLAEEKAPIFAHREDGQKNTPLEKKADKFAAELLMPEELVKKVIKDFDSFTDDYYVVTSAIMDVFNVSRPAAEYRYDTLMRGY